MSGLVTQDVVCRPDRAVERAAAAGREIGEAAGPASPEVAARVAAILRESRTTKASA